LGNFYSPVKTSNDDGSEPARPHENLQLASGHPFVPAQISTSWLRVYFTSPPVKETDPGVAKYVIEEINNAKKSVDAASDDFNLPSVVNALVNAANKKGVTVRVIYDGTSGHCAITKKDGTVTFNALATMQKNKKIQLKDGGRLPQTGKEPRCAAADDTGSSGITGIMHDKIVIVDGKTLFTGSWNISANDTYRNNNNLLQITNPTLIANYQAVFDEIFHDTDTTRTVGAKTPDLNIGGIKVQNYFSPHDKVMEKIIALVAGAQKSIRFMAFTYTSPILSQAMVAKANENKNVVVQGVFETRQAVNRVAFLTLSCAKVKGTINVKLDGNSGTMHHKVIIIDDKIVITGSFNFTANANNNNDENVLVIYDKEIAKQYITEFDKIFSDGKDLKQIQAQPTPTPPTPATVPYKCP
jgi:phosphatidylserine/phosphatidylglycerophosphate/cardiolipin synthase-like enzyme